MAKASRKGVGTARRMLLILLIVQGVIIPFVFYHAYSVSVRPAVIESSLPNNTVQQKTIYQSPVQTVDGENLCVLIRTYVGHGLALPRQIIGWAINAQRLGPKDPIQHVSLYTTNTHYQQNRKDDKHLVKLMDQTVSFFNDDEPSLDLHFIPLPEGFHSERENYGYDATNYLLNLTLQPALKSQCDRYVITNGDNTYNSDLLLAINNEILKHDADVIGFDFTSRYIRQGFPHTKVDANFKLGFIDLGAAVIKKRAITDLCSNAPLLFSFESGAFVADWTFFNNLIKCNATTALVKQVLLHHQ